jgi:hypothetical protein
MGVKIRRTGALDRTAWASNVRKPDQHKNVKKYSNTKKWKTRRK